MSFAVYWTNCLLIVFPKEYHHPDYNDIDNSCNNTYSSWCNDNYSSNNNNHSNNYNPESKSVVDPVHSGTPTFVVKCRPKYTTTTAAIAYMNDDNV